MKMQRTRDEMPGARWSRPSRVGRLLPCLGGVLMLAAAMPIALSAQVSLISVNRNGVQAEGRSDSPSVNANGAIVAFASNASNIVNEGDRQNEIDVFTRFRSENVTQMESFSRAGTSGNADSRNPSISADGLLVVFSSLASNLVDGDDNGLEDVFLRDISQFRTERISVGVDGEANGASGFPRISADGRFVVFQSQATNLTGDEDTSTTDIFVHDRDTGETRKVSVPPGGGLTNGPSITPAISGDGSTVAFISSATNLVPGDTTIPDVFVRVLAGNAIEKVSVSTSGTPANEISFFPALNFDGTIVAFKSEAFNLVANDTNGVPDTFVHDRNEGTTTRISVDDFGNESNGLSGPPAISGDGCDVAFASQASNLVLEDKNGNRDLFVVDRCGRNGQRRIARIGETASNGNGPNGEVPDAAPSVSQNGHAIGFASTASDLIPSDINNELDVFIAINPLNPPGPEPSPTPTPSETPDGFCDENEDCPPGQVCDPVTMRCVTPSPTPSRTATNTPPGFCDENEDCPPGQVCDPVTMRCVTPSPTPTPVGFCDGNEDCPPGQVCDPVTMRCVTQTPTPTATPIGFCDDNEDCPPGQVCDPATDRCVTPSPTRTPVGFCDDDEDCPPGQVCDPETMMCVDDDDGGGGGCSCDIDPRQRREDPTAAIALLIPAVLLGMRWRERTGARS